MAKNLKETRKELQNNGVFYTMPELANYVKQLAQAECSEIKEVYDPTCGAGGLLLAFGDDVLKVGQDIDQHSINELSQQPNTRVKNGDLFTNPILSESERFDLIVSNYPFSVKWTPNNHYFFDVFDGVYPTESRADYAFIAQILHHLSENGTAIVIAHPGILYRGNREQVMRSKLANYVKTVISIEGGHFVDTAISVAILVISKKGNDGKITFKDKQKDKEISVSLAEIADNDYNLSVSSYIIDNHEKEVIDGFELENEVQKAFLNSLKTSLEMSYVVDKVFNEGNVLNFCNKIINQVEQFKIIKGLDCGNLITKKEVLKNMELF